MNTKRIVILITTLISCVNVFSQGLSGSRTIGVVPSNFETFADAIDSLTTYGISGPLVFYVVSGTYTEQISIPDITGTSSSDTIVFQSLSGNSPDVTLTWASTTSTDNYTVRLNGADYVSFRNMTISATGSTYARVIEFTGNSTNNRLIGDRIEGVSTSDESEDRALVYSSYGTSEHNNSFQDNQFINGSCGICFKGNNNGTLVSGNQFTDQYLKAIALEYQDAAMVKGNTITSNSSSTNFYGIYCRYCDGGVIVRNNSVDRSNNFGGYGIYFTSCNGQSGTEQLIANNAVHMNTFGNPCYGIRCVNSTYHEIYYNSINLTGTRSDSKGLEIASGSSSIFIKNNIFKNAAGGYAIYSFVTSGVTTDYNDLYSTGVNLAYWNVNVPDLASWKSATQQASNSINADPVYFTDSDLHAANLLLQSGTTVPEVTLDMDGETRDGSNPCMGADEFIYSAMGGDYTIGPSGDFSSFTEAVQALDNGGLRAAVNFSVVDGTYTEQITLKDIHNISESNRVTFQSASGDSSSVELTYTPSGSGDNFTVRMDGAHHFTFRNLTISTGGTDYSNVFYMIHFAWSNHFFNNQIIGSQSAGIVEGELFNGATDYIGGNYIFRNNHLKYGSYGIDLVGIHPDATTGTEIKNNRFIDQTENAIRMYSHKSPVIEGNYIFSSVASSYYGIRCYYSDGTLIISRNIMTAPNSTGGYGIYFLGCEGNPSNEGIISNNHISLHSDIAGSYCHGIQIRNTINQKFLNNNVIVSGGLATSMAIYLRTTSSGLNIQNNIIANLAGGYAFYSEETTGMTSDYNDLFSSGISLGFWNSVDQSDLSAWQSASGQDANSVSLDPKFPVEDDPHFPNPFLNDAATPVSEVTDDIDGEMRDPAAPDIGADEFCLPPVAKDTSGCTTRAIPDLTASGSNIKWYGDGALTVLLHSGSTFTSGQTSAGTYTYYATQTVHESESQADTVTLTINTTPGIPPATDETICYGETTPDLAATGTDLKWYEDETLTSQVGSGTSYSTGITDVGVYPYYVTQTTDACESDPDTSVLTIHSIPAPPANETFISCFGSPVPDLSAVGENIKWYSDEGLSSPVHNGDTYSSGDTLAGDYAYFPTQSIFGCESGPAYDTLRIKPRPDIPEADSQAVCIGETVPDLDASGDSIRWYSDAERLTLLHSGNKYVTGISEVGIYPFYLTQTLDGCESLNKLITLAIHGLPEPFVIDDEVICEVDTQDYYLGTTGKTSHSYAWTGDLSSTLSDPVAKPTDPGTYRYFLTETIDTTGCQSSDSVFITVHPDPIAAVLADQVLCSSATKAYQIGSLSVAGNSYSWVSNPAGFTSSLSNPTVTPTASISYTLTETIDATNCSRSNSVAFTINPNPDAYVTEDRTICHSAAQDFSLGGEAVAGNSYAWTSSHDGWTSTSSNPVVQPADPGSYTYTLTETIDATDCKATSPVTILIHPNPVIAITPGQNPIEQGIGTNLTASGALTYVWSPASGLSGTTGAQVTASPTENSTYFLEGTNQYGCKDYDTIGLWVYCPACSSEDPFYGSTGTFNFGCTNNLYKDNLNCSWTILPSGVDSIYLHFRQPFDVLEGDYVRVYDGGDATAPLIGEYHNASPPPDLIGAGSDMFVRFVTDGQDGGLGFRAEWSNVPIVDNLDDVTQSQFKIYPNPAGNTLTVEFNSVYKGATVIRIFSETGQPVSLHQILCEPGLVREEIDIGTFRAGIYIIQAVMRDQVIIRKFFKE